MYIDKQHTSYDSDTHRYAATTDFTYPELELTAEMQQRINIEVTQSICDKLSLVVQHIMEVTLHSDNPTLQLIAIARSVGIDLTQYFGSNSIGQISEQIGVSKPTLYHAIRKEEKRLNLKSSTIQHKNI